MCVFVCAEECVGEVKTALVPIAAGSGGAVAREETDASETARVGGGRTEQDAYNRGRGGRERAG